MLNKKKTAALFLTASMMLTCTPFTALAATTGWQTDGDYRVYVKKDGSYTKGWKEIGKKWYYFDKKGHAVTGLKEIKKKTYYFNSKGAMQKGWQEIDGKKKYFGKDGVEVFKDWVKSGGKWYYVKKNGVMATGVTKIGKTLYNFKSSGVRKTGWETNEDGTKYYFTSKGAVKGWKEISKKWYYFNTDTFLMTTGVKKISKKYYVFSAKGVMLKNGLKKATNGHSYYLDKKGVALTSDWKQIGSDWYYFGKSGKMATGLTEIGKDTYFFYEDGKMAKSVTIDGMKFDKNGKLVSKTLAVTGTTWKNAIDGAYVNTKSLELVAKFNNYSGSKVYFKVTKDGEELFCGEKVDAKSSVTFTFAPEGDELIEEGFVKPGSYTFTIYSDKDKKLASETVEVTRNDVTVTEARWYLADDKDGNYSNTKKLNLDVDFSNEADVYYTVSKDDSVLFTSDVTKGATSLAMYYSKSEGAELVGGRIPDGFYKFTVYTESGKEVYSATAKVSNGSSPVDPGNGDVIITWLYKDEEFTNWQEYDNVSAVEFAATFKEDAEFYYTLSKGNTVLYTSSKVTTSNKRYSGSIYGFDDKYLYNGYLVAGEYTLTIYNTSDEAVGSKNVKINNNSHEQIDYETVWTAYADYGSGYITLETEVTKLFQNGLYAALYYAPSGTPSSSDQLLYDATAMDYNFIPGEFDEEDSNQLPDRYEYTFVFNDSSFESGLYYVILAEDEASVGNPLAVVDVEYTKPQPPDPIDPDKFLVWSWNEEILNTIQRYSDAEFQYSTTPSNAYRQALDVVLTTGEGAPDMYGLEAGYIQEYMNTNKAIPVSQLGITDEELSDMFSYTLNIGSSSDGKVMALAWGAHPGGVFYNRSVAQKYLGVSAPNDVQTYYSSWDKFLELSRTVNTNSNGTVKATAAIADSERAYLAGRTRKWVVNGVADFDSCSESFLDFGKLLFNENLTFNAAQWSSDEWMYGSTNGTVLSYFGPMWLGQYSLGIVEYDGTVVKDEWGFVKAPTDFFWGGTWVAASPYCKNKETAAKILRDVCLDQNNLTLMAKNNEFVNSKTVMNRIKYDSSWKFNWLGGQNPVAKLIEIAEGCDNQLIDEDSYTDYYYVVADQYINGEIDSVAQAKQVFKAMIADDD